MNTVYGNVVLITGASSGIGRATAEFLAKEGYRVYGTSRKVDAGDINQEKPSDTGGFIRMLRMDVQDNDSVNEAVNRILQIEGSIDILINNAGFGIAGAIEDTSPEEAFKQIDTNFLGMHRVTRAVLPVMRSRGKGLIVNISSVAALIPIPFQAMYCASKAAIESFSEILRMEVKPLGIKVAIVEPGDTKTGFTASRENTLASAKDSAYFERFGRGINVMIHDETHGPEPVVVSKVISRLLRRRNPPVKIAVGFKYKVFLLLKRVLPYRFVLFVLAKLY